MELLSTLVACLERVKWFYYTCIWNYRSINIRNKLTLQIVDCGFLKLPQLHDILPYLPVQCSLLIRISSIGFSVYLMTQLELNGPSKVNTWLSQWWRHSGGQI